MNRHVQLLLIACAVFGCGEASSDLSQDVETLEEEFSEEPGKADGSGRARLVRRSDHEYTILVPEASPLAVGGSDVPPSAFALDIDADVLIEAVSVVYFVDDAVLEDLSVALTLPDGTDVVVAENAGSFGSQANPEFTHFERVPIPEADGSSLSGRWVLQMRARPSGFRPQLRSWGIEFAVRSP